MNDDLGRLQDMIGLIHGIDDEHAIMPALSPCR
jgi:hypothetical protein